MNEKHGKKTLEVDNQLKENESFESEGSESLTQSNEHELYETSRNQIYESSLAAVVTQRILNTFMMKETKLHIDDNRYLLSPEESEKRIIKMLSFLTLSLSFIWLVLTLCCIIMMKKSNKDDFEPIIIYPKTNELVQNNPMRRQHLVLIDSDGKLFDFKFSVNNTFSPSWQMKVPPSTDYFGFINERKINIIYGHKTEITSIKSDKFHRKIPNSLPKGVCLNVNILSRIRLEHSICIQFVHRIWKKSSILLVP